jgi:hypothetical protein
MDWKCGLHSRVPAFQVQSPEFKTQFHQKKKKKMVLPEGSIYLFVDLVFCFVFFFFPFSLFVLRISIKGKNNIAVFRAEGKNRGKARQKQKTARFVPEMEKSVEDDVEENQKDSLQKASTTYDLDCDKLGMSLLVLW